MTVMGWTIKLLFLTSICLASEETADVGKVQIEDTGETKTEGSLNDAAPEEQEFDLSQLKEINRAMELFRNMNCMMSMEHFLSINSQKIEDLKRSPKGVMRYDRVIINLYKACKKSEDDAGGIEKMIESHSKGEDLNYENMFKDVNLEEIMEIENPELNEEEQKYLDEVKKVGEEISKMQKQAMKEGKKIDEEDKAKEKAKRKARSKSKSNTKKPRVPPKKKKTSNGNNFWGLVSILIVGSILGFLLLRLLKEDEPIVKKRKKDKKKKNK
jgi:hypothetical protein